MRFLRRLPALFRRPVVVENFHVTVSADTTGYDAAMREIIRQMDRDVLRQPFRSLS